MPMNTNTDIIIKPLFNQEAPAVWDNFVEIEMAARSAEYNHLFLYGAFDNMWNVHHEDWNMLEYNISFAAYHGEKMVGFVKGFLVDSCEFKLDSLFVDPDFKRQGIAKRLLSAFENSASLIGSYVQGIAFDGARGFYKKQNYNITGGKCSNPILGKKLEGPNVGVIPVFDKWKSANFRIKSNVKVDGKLLRSYLHQPIFVYVNPEHKIDAVGLRTKDGKDLIWSNDKLSKCLKDCRERAIQYQLEHSR